MTKLWLTFLFHQISSSPMLFVTDEYEKLLCPILTKKEKNISMKLKFIVKF